MTIGIKGQLIDQMRASLQARHQDAIADLFRAAQANENLEQYESAVVVLKRQLDALDNARVS